MAELDKDLLSIQEARTLATQARDAQRKFLHATQAEVDRICAAMAQAAADAAVTLGKMANEETGYGVPEHKTLKNLLASQLLWEEIKDVPTVGVIRSNKEKGTNRAHLERLKLSERPNLRGQRGELIVVELGQGQEEKRDESSAQRASEAE